MHQTPSCSGCTPAAEYAWHCAGSVAAAISKQCMATTQQSRRSWVKRDSRSATMGGSGGSGPALDFLLLVDRLLLGFLCMAIHAGKQGVLQFSWLTGVRSGARCTRGGRGERRRRRSAAARPRLGGPHLAAHTMPRQGGTGPDLRRGVQLSSCSWSAAAALPEPRQHLPVHPHACRDLRLVRAHRRRAPSKAAGLDVGRLAAALGRRAGLLRLLRSWAAGMKAWVCLWCRPRRRAEAATGTKQLSSGHQLLHTPCTRRPSCTTRSSKCTSGRHGAALTYFSAPCRRYLSCRRRQAAR